MAKRKQQGKQGFGIDEPIDSIHMGEGKRIRLEDVPQEGSTGDQQVGNRAYNDERYQAKGSEQATVARWIIPPVVQWTRSGYIYATNMCSYELPGSTSPIVALPQTKTLNSPDPTLDRFDLFVWNDLGQCVIIEGTPAAEPIVPVVADPLTQIAGPFVLVKGGSTEPDPGNLTSTVIYNENTEWTGTVVGCTGNFDNTSPVFTGFKSLDISAIANNDYIEFTAPANFNPKTFDSFGMQIRMKSALLGNMQNITLRFFDVSNNPVSNERNLGINKNLVDSWQLAGVAISSFTFTSEIPLARKIRLRWNRGVADHPGFYADLIQLQGGILNPPSVGTVILTGQVSGSGQTGTPINVTVTEKFISDQTEQTDPLPSTAQTTWRLADGSLRKVAASLLFTTGVAGDDGWSPIFGLVTDGERRVLQLVDWTGGEGTKPGTGQYIGPTGLVATAAEAVDLRGATGPAGADGIDGTNGTDGREVELRVDGTNLQWRYVGDVSWITLIDLSTIGGSGGIQSVTGDGVDDTDPDNPIITQYPEASTSTVIDFTKPKTFGSFGTPITGAITESDTNAKRVVQVIFYSGASFTAPSANWKLSANSADYATSGVNIIYVEYFSDTYKRYWIDQDV